MKKSSIVIDLSFGDCGKGSLTSYLVSKSTNPIVVRFNGGQNAGHQVFVDNKRHVFACFGSGTLQGAPTFWSEYCTVYPIAVANEYKALKAMGIKPVLFIDPLAPVTTPWDYLSNRIAAKITNHGSTGVGFGSTHERQSSGHKLHYMDLFFPSIMHAKLKNIEHYYKRFPLKTFEDINILFGEWYDAIQFLIDEGIFTERAPSQNYEEYIFEGAQGILLDENFGFFPNVTRSTTTSKNARELITKYDLPEPEIYYVTRAYQTRHGAGFMSNETKPIILINNDNEVNVEDEYQGKFRTSVLDIDMINYALICDFTSLAIPRHLVITCLDQVPNLIPYTYKGKDLIGSVTDIIDRIDANFKSKLYSYSPNGTLMETTARP